MINEEEFCGEFDMKVGNSISLRFNELSSAGYVWSVECSDEGQGLHVTQAYVSKADDLDEPKEIGSPVVKEFTMTALKPGEYEVRYSYARPFDDGDPEKTEVYHVNVYPNEKPKFTIVS